MINYKLYKGNDSSHIIVFCGGIGDTKEAFHNLATDLSKNHDLNSCAWDYSIEYRKEANLDVESISKGIRKLLRELEKIGYKEFTIWGTSLGAVPTVLSVVSTDSNIKSLIFIDPADYYTDPEEFRKHPKTWDGGEKYNPISQTLSNLLSQVKGDTKVNVVHFGLKNCKNKGYIDEKHEDRGRAYEDGIPRLNRDMAMSFYTSTPEKNRGEFIDDNILPHGIFNYGDIKKNQERLVELTLEFIQK